MTVKGGTSPACAVCKFQRRKCKPDCVLAPHFPANQDKAFRNVHRLFGVSNIMKILKKLQTDEQKEEAMKSIKYESDMRQRYPVYGCTGILCQLQQQFLQSIEELRYVYAQLAVFREQYNNGNNNNNPMQSPPSYLQLGMNSNAPVFDAQVQQFQSDQPTFLMNQYFGTSEYDDHIFIDNPNHFAKDLMGLEQNYYDSVQNNNLMIGTHHVFDTNPVVEDERGKQVYEDDGDSEFNTFADDRQSYIETKEASECSSESFPQGSRDQVCENDLKNAAACFSLTNTSCV